MLLRFVHFDIHKFEFEEYLRTNRMNIIKNPPIFEEKNLNWKICLYWCADWMTFEDVQISGTKMLSVKVLPLVWFFAAVKMQIFWKHNFDHFGGQNQPTFKIFWKSIEQISLFRCSMRWLLKIFNNQGQERCLQSYWFGFSLLWRCK